VSTCANRSSAQARHVVESWPPENRTRADRAFLSFMEGLYGPQPFSAPQRCLQPLDLRRTGGTMFVSDILSQKGGLVHNVTPDTSVAQICQQLRTRRIGSVLVLDGDTTVLGIVSERDLVRAMASHGAKAIELQAHHIMTRDVVTCDPDDSIDH